MFPPKLHFVSIYLRLISSTFGALMTQTSETSNYLKKHAKHERHLVSIFMSVVKRFHLRFTRLIHIPVYNYLLIRLTHDRNSMKISCVPLYESLTHDRNSDFFTWAGFGSVILVKKLTNNNEIRTNKWKLLNYNGLLMVFFHIWGTFIQKIDLKP